MQLFKNVCLDHVLEEQVKLVLSVAKVAALDVVRHLLSPASAWVVELKVPEEVVGVLKVGSHREDLVDEILHTDETTLAELVLDEDVVGEGNSLAVHLAEASLVDEVSDVLEGRVAPGDVGLGNAEHVDGRLVQLHEDTVVDLAQTEELEHLSGLGWDAVDTVWKMKVRI